MIRRILKLFAIVLWTAIVPVMVTGQAPGGKAAHRVHGLEKDIHGPNGDRYDGWAFDPVVFTSRDRSIIREYYKSRSAHLPPDVSRRGPDRPPVLQRPLKRNGTLPAVLQNPVEYLPMDLEGRMRPLLTFYRREIIGREIAIVEIRTQRIVDVVHAIAGLGGLQPPSPGSGGIFSASGNARKPTFSDVTATGK